LRKRLSTALVSLVLILCLTGTVIAAEGTIEKLSIATFPFAESARYGRLFCMLPVMAASTTTLWIPLSRFRMSSLVGFIDSPSFTSMVFPALLRRYGTFSRLALDFFPRYAYLSLSS
jgi:hypothetical protein